MNLCVARIMKMFPFNINGRWLLKKSVIINIHVYREKITEQKDASQWRVAITRLYRELSQRASGSCFRSGWKEGWGQRVRGLVLAIEVSRFGSNWQPLKRFCGRAGVEAVHNATGGFLARRFLVGTSMYPLRRGAPFLVPSSLLLRFVLLVFFFFFPSSSSFVPMRNTRDGPRSSASLVPPVFYFVPGA